MMRNLLAGIGLAVLVLGCRPSGNSSSSGAAADADLLLRCHFVGVEQLARDTNAARLRTVLAQPTTRAVVDQALARLAQAPSTRGLAPFVPDLLKAESFIELRGNPAQPDCVFAARLPADRAGFWLSNWTRMPVPDPTVKPQVAQAGAWVVGGLGAGSLKAFETARQNIARSGRPGAGEPGAWLSLEADLPRLAGTLGLPDALPWPHARLGVVGRGANLRTAARLTFDRDLSMPPEAWRIPTNTIRDPLISFTAAQGVRPWLAEWKLVKDLGLPAPNQVFAWSQSQVPYQSYFAWEMPDAGERIANTATLVPAAFRAQWPWLNFGELQYATNIQRLLWNGFPIVVPYINPAADPGFVVAGIFPTVNPQPPAPPDLYGQVIGRTNLMYYHWEVTQPRVGDWHAMSLVHGMLAGLMPPKVEAPAHRWLQDTNALRPLGNTVTEITRVSPRELSLVRNSAVGFTAWELTQLARWLDGENFPRWTPAERASAKKRPPATPPPAPKPGA